MVEARAKAPFRPSAGSTDVLLRELVAHLRENRTQLREEWARRITEAKLLTAMTPDEIFAEATAVYDDSDRLAFTIYQEQRIEVPLSQMSPHVLRAIVAIEDQRFYDHHGFDVYRIGSAALANFRHMRRVQGASTITQQLARQSFLTPDKTLRRKMQELILAGQIEQFISRICGFGKNCSIWPARISSCILRRSVLSGVRKLWRASCCVIVLPPCARRPRCRLRRNAAPMRMTSIPLCSKNR